MSLDVLLGLQWGDEGKGKIVDLLAKDYDTIARYQGGPNAGHTIITGSSKFILHQIPSGILHEGVDNVIGNGVVINPLVLRKEIQQLKDAGVETGRLYISDKAHIILPTHVALDAASEDSKGDLKIGTTRRGISPAYQDKYSRIGLRAGELKGQRFKKRYQELKEQHARNLELLYGYEAVVEDAEWLDAAEWMSTLKITCTEGLLYDKLKAGAHVLAEGAQGALLDIDFGDYPYVTSSNTGVGGAITGLGISPNYMRKVIGIFKAYCTRVGEGPFPTELHNEQGAYLADKGHEKGSTTGRPRRCGWLDLVKLRTAINRNGVTHLYMMKADVLDGIGEVQVAVDYTHNKVQLQSVDGWQKDLYGVEEIEQAPTNLLKYIEMIEKELEQQVHYVSTGPDRRSGFYLKEQAALA